MRSLFAHLLIVAMMAGGAGCAGAQQESPLLGKKAPDFTLERVGGTSASLSQIISGKKAILFFFSTWCPHCREQIKELQARKSEMEKQGVVVALVDIGESKEKVVKFLTAHGLNNDAFLDSGSLVAQSYEVMGVPTFVFIGIDGKVRYVEYGLPENYLEILK